MTYAELKQQLQDWADSTETRFVGTTGIDICIKNAEKAINDRVMLPDAKLTTTFATAIGVSTVSVTVPTAAILQVYFTGEKPLVRKSSSYIREFFVGAANAKPTHYAWLRATQSGSTTTNTLLLGPTPDAIYSFNFEYVTAQPTSIVTATTGTWLSMNAEAVLRKQALYQAAVFLKQWESAKILKDDADSDLMVLAQTLAATAMSDEERP